MIGDARTAQRLPPAGALLVMLLVTLLAGGCSGDRGAASRGAASEEPPTVLLVTIDTLRADRVGCYGRDGAGTPRLDALAAAGARFSAAQTTAPITAPAHASILTGRTLPAHGVLENGTFALPVEIPTLAEAFRGKGWATGAFISSQVLARSHGLSRGFDVYDDQMPRRDLRQGAVLSYAQRRGVETVDVALAWLATIGRRPAFLWVHLFEPHLPYAPPPEFAALHPNDPYQGEVATADSVLGRLLDGLAAEGRGERRLVVVASDHGEGLGEHHEQAHGIYLYQGVMRVPLVVHGPAHGIRTGVLDEVVSVCDIAPTLAELTGLPPLAGADGASLAGLLTGKGPGPTRPGVFAESHTPRLQHGWSGLRAFVSGSAKLIEAPRPEFYDLAADPEESEDLAGQRPAEVDDALRALTGMVARAREVAPQESAERVATEEEMAQLRALGYAASGRRAEEGDLVDRDATDPKDRGEFIARYDKALAKSESKHPEQALPLFEELLALEPDNPALLESYGRALILTGELERAIEVFRHAVEIDPDYGLGWHRLGQLLDNRKDARGAEAAYRRAISADPLSIVSCKALASLLAEQGRFEEAIPVLEQAEALDGKDEAVRALLAEARAKAVR